MTTVNAIPTQDQHAPPVGSRRRQILGVLRSRGWVVALAALLTGLVGLLASASTSPTYTVRAVFVVPAVTGTEAAPGRPDQAARLATTYAFVIPEDDQLVSEVADAVGLTGEKVRDRTTVTNEASTGVIYVQTESPTEDGAIALAKAWQDSLTRTEGSRAVAAGSIRTVSVPDSATPGPNVPPLGAGILGALIGAMLGLLTAWAWERSQGRLSTALEVQEALGVYAVSGSPDMVTSVVEVSAKMHGGGPVRGSRTVVVPTPSLNGAPLAALADCVAQGAHPVTMVPAEDGSPEQAETLLAADAIIVAAPVGVPQSELQHALDALATLGLTTGAVFLVEGEGS